MKPATPILLLAGAAYAASSSRAGGHTQPGTSTFQAKPARGKRLALESVSSTVEKRLGESGGNYAKVLAKGCHIWLKDGAISQPEQNRVCKNMYSALSKQIDRLEESNNAPTEKAKFTSRYKILDDVIVDFHNFADSLVEVSGNVGCSLQDYAKPYLNQDKAVISKQWDEINGARSELQEEITKGNDPERLVYALTSNMMNLAYYMTLSEGGKIYYDNHPINPGNCPSPTLTSSPSSTLTASASPTLTPSPSATPALKAEDGFSTGEKVGIAFAGIISAIASASAGAILGYAFKREKNVNDKTDLETGGGDKEPNSSVVN